MELNSKDLTFHQVLEYFEFKFCIITGKLWRLTKHEPPGYFSWLYKDMRERFGAKLRGKGILVFYQIEYTLIKVIIYLPLTENTIY